MLQRHKDLGAAAENLVVSKYVKSGFEVLARNFRRPDTGEIDLIVKHANKLYFVETKFGRDFDAAAARLTQSQRARIHKTAQRFLAETHRDQTTEMRFDAALVTPEGGFQVLPGALN
ncbi:MAG: YraN family protein [Pseudomonadota bacterium]